MLSGIGFICARSQIASTILSSYFLGRADDVKSKLSSSTRSDLRQLSQRLLDIHTADTTTTQERDL